MFDSIQMFRKKKYEASIYFIRELEESPQREDDLPYFLIRLHDIYIKKRNVHSVFEHVKNFIRIPRTDDDGIWRNVLRKYGIPFAGLQWKKVTNLEPEAEKSVFSLFSETFYHNGLACQIEIRVYCEHREVTPLYVFSPEHTKYWRV